MRERLDCALLTLGENQWAKALCGNHLAGRLVLHVLQQPHETAGAMLSDPSMTRGRYDAGLMYVDESTLRLWRTALAAQAGQLPATLLVYAVGLRSQAIRDLLALGVADFLRPPFCPEELRARLERTLEYMSASRLAENAPVYGSTIPGLYLGSTRPSHSRPLQGQGMAGTTEASLCETILDRSGTELEAYAVALAMQRATSHESFRAAKGQIVARFERAYIRAALGRHGGNITLAARMAQKHRRAFWALMRKHDIDPAPYRYDDTDDRPQSPQGG